MRFYLVNAFTNQEYEGGNPSVIVLLKNEQSSKWMQACATSFNQPITCFIVEKNQGFEIRWFTPICEIALCGHGTLGAAYVLFKEGFVSNQSPIIFNTNSGKLHAEKSGDFINIRMKAKKSVPVTLTDELRSTINQNIVNVEWAEDRYILELEGRELVQKAVPNLESIRRLQGTGVIITSSCRDKYDFVSRYFAPKIGVNEDIVTGSSHCALGPYWKKRLNKSLLYAYQHSEQGGELKLNVYEDGIDLYGRCVITHKDTIMI
ncbi:PhzF family phenazine biosynthesis isomerase [Bacillus carboniphilus]|uniref:PhzF family phenazine biosynthesis isomerase n=1 Tax=Bacillus carboniphilus TaxID=86663 RepID=A0ABY9JUP3_9BACI|nr:PhzF family phenazine biosynthesis isomerase [Bacillus carboniphilus]WLR42150.1 PhzF family phenazine biosynthesis isomerase [Bacillus carboniphilus]